MKRFKGLSHCSKHDQYYHWKYGCKKCRKANAENMKPIDQVLKEMEEKGLIPEGLNERSNSDHGGDN